MIAAPANSTTDVQLHYLVRGYGSGRLCLSLRHGPLHFYRGPILHRDRDALSAYASGCFALGQPITLQGLGPGMWSLDAEGREATSEARLAPSAVAPTIYFAVMADDHDEFEANYEWQSVGQGQSVPSGLDVKLDLARKAPRRAEYVVST